MDIHSWVSSSRRKTLAIALKFGDVSEKLCTMFQTLPHETLIEILRNLHHRELLKVSEVSKRFYDVTTDPSLWEDFDISQRSLDDKIKVLQLPRCKKLKTLKLTIILRWTSDGNNGGNVKENKSQKNSYTRRIFEESTCKNS